MRRYAAADDITPLKMPTSNDRPCLMAMFDAAIDAVFALYCCCRYGFADARRYATRYIRQQRRRPLMLMPYARVAPILYTPHGFFAIDAVDDAAFAMLLAVTAPWFFMPLWCFRCQRRLRYAVDIFLR